MSHASHWTRQKVSHCHCSLSHFRVSQTDSHSVTWSEDWESIRGNTFWIWANDGGGRNCLKQPVDSALNRLKPIAIAGDRLVVGGCQVNICLLLLLLLSRTRWALWQVSLTADAGIISIRWLTDRWSFCRSIVCLQKITWSWWMKVWSSDRVYLAQSLSRWQTCRRINYWTETGCFTQNRSLTVHVPCWCQSPPVDEDCDEDN